MILKGQNFRILVFDSTAEKFKCVGMSTNCSINLNSNTDEGGTKDDVGMAAKPIVTSQSWSVSVDSLNVSDVGAMLTAMKSLTPFTLMWDETSTTDNQTPEEATFARTGTAYLNDATFQFDDRTNASKSLQFTGSGPLGKLSDTPAFEAISAGSYTKGQFVRLFLSGDNTTAPAAVIAAARTLSLHVSMTLESATTKDTDGTWDVQEPTALNYDITTGALVRGNDTITSAVGAKSYSDLMDIYESGGPVKWQIANVSGDNQRTKGSVIASGSATITSLQTNAAVKQNADYTATLTGYGAYTVGS
jgi:predicted secreted protein